ncbi:sterol desaturase family protein, partial [Aeromonas australiensis]|uniref:sterol desaturase family protein n=1 Tax=Aeromonas australiensis TaxID=1114880 RepID=UPI001F457F28
HPVNQGMFVIIAGVFSGFYSGALNVFFTNQNLFLIFADQNVFMFIFLFLGLNLQHSHIQLRYPPVIRSILVSPAYHQLHHSSAIEHYDKNFGFIFSFWDKLFGTQVLVTTPIKIKFGIKGEDYFEYSGLLNHYITPFKRVKILLSNKLRGRHKDIPNVMDG